MSVRTQYSIIKGVNQETAKKAIVEATKLFPGSPPKHSKWSDWTYVVKPKTLEAYISGNMLVITDHAWPIAKEIARIVNAPHLELRVQESDHWDFTLCHRATVIADFSMRVAYYDDNPNSPRPWKTGSADAFAKVWGIPAETILPYLVDWDASPSNTFCREGDEYPTGDWEQIFDFMSALGINQLASHTNNFAFLVPWWEGAYVRQPAWRCAIRKMSVWVKGTYPDVRRHTKAEKEEWKRRRSRIRIVRVALEDIVDRDSTT